MAQISKYILMSVILWMLALGVAFSCFDATTAAPQSRVMQSTESMEMQPGHIMRNNLACVLLNMSGIAFAGVPTVFNLIYNGFVSGIILRQISSTSLPYSELYYYGRHHAIEFLALWFSGGIGLCGIALFRTVVRTGRLPVKKYFINLAVMASAIILITIGAAVMETDISLAAYTKNITVVASIDTLVIIPRALWYAHPIDTSATIDRRDDSTITMIIIHHSGFPGTTSPLRLQEYQMNIRGMDDLAYHFLISAKGCVYEGRPISMRGQHTSAGGSIFHPNAVSIGVCLGGNYETESPGPPIPQKTALRHLLGFLCKRYHIPHKQILFHRDVTPDTTRGIDSSRIAGTVCPGRYAILPLTRLIDTLETQ